MSNWTRVLDHREHDGDLLLLMLTDADPIVWRLRFELVGLDEPHECLTGLTYVGRWNGDAVFMHPATRAEDEPWEPHRADMTLVKP